MNSLLNGGANQETNWVVDSSALLALILEEEGREAVENALQAGAALSLVNLVEVVTKLIDVGYAFEDALSELDQTGVDVANFPAEDAQVAASLRSATRAQGLSLGDRACLALARRLDKPALTTDRQWANVAVGVQVIVCR